MKPSAFAYHAPRELDEALSLLAELGDDGKVLAGGQSLVPMMNMRLAAPGALVDITRIDALGGIDLRAGALSVGAAVTHERLRKDQAAVSACPLVRQALDWVAHPVIRNRGTAVGSIAHADPAAELPAVLALLGGQVQLRSAAGERTVTGADFTTGPLESDVRPGELVTAAVFPTDVARTGTAFHELARRHGDYALAGVAVTVRLDTDDSIEAARAAFIGVGDAAVLVDLGGALEGQAFDALRTDEAVAHARAQLDPYDDVHASGSYRRHLAGVLLGRALVEAAARAASQQTASQQTASQQTASQQTAGQRTASEGLT